MKDKKTYLKVKRIIDILFSLLMFCISSPLLLITAIAIKLDSRGPVIFRQKRIGRNCRLFTLYKFRSMCIGAESGGVYETKNDKRVTRIGRFIRKTSLDEFPQFINILKGDMSLIGPRPVLTYHPWPLEEYTPEQKRRFIIRPGITGLAQINGRKDLQWNKRIEYDLEYIDNLSFSLDLKIFIKTIHKVLFFKDNINIDKTVEKK